MSRFDNLGYPPIKKTGVRLPSGHSDPTPDKDFISRKWGFTPPFHLGLRRVLEFGAYEGTLLALHFFKDDWVTVEGSAAMLAPGIAVTASHVVKDLQEEFERKGLSMYAVAPTRGDTLVTWDVVRIILIQDTDLCILILNLGQYPEDRTIHSLLVTARMPDIEENVLICGFRSTDEFVAADKSIYFHAEPDLKRSGVMLLASVGRVSNHFLDGRRGVGSVIEVDCETEGGMSGGAAFDQSGRLFGILSSSVAGGPSYVAHIWPALGTAIPPTSLLRTSTDIPLVAYPPEVCDIEFRESIAVAESTISWTDPTKPREK